MSTRAESILEEALTLSEVDRVHIGLRLLDSATSDAQIDLDHGWCGEVLRRIRSIEAGDALFQEARGHLRSLLEKYSGS